MKTHGIILFLFKIHQQILCLHILLYFSILVINGVLLKFFTMKEPVIWESVLHAATPYSIVLDMSNTTMLMGQRI